MDVLIAGGGPTGLMLAGELALAGVSATIVERRATQDLAGLRAGGLNARTLEVLDQRGIVDRFLAEGQTFARAPFGGAVYDISDLPTRHHYFLSLWQVHTERLLAGWVQELGGRIERGCEVNGFCQDQDGITAELSDGRRCRAQFLVACDGGRSRIRKQAGIDFPGWEATISYLIAEVEFGEEPAWGMRRHGSAGGFGAIAKVEGSSLARVVVSEPEVFTRDAPGEDTVRLALRGLYGTDFGLRTASYVSRFSDQARQAAVYRQGRVLLTGDAAHIHSPMGGQGLNVGVQDAVNLGWKLGQVVRGISPESLLDTYQAERHPVGARLLRNTRALTALEHGDERTAALRDMLSELMQGDGMRQRYFEMMTGLDICYDLGPQTHPLIGRRMPDLDLVTAEGPTRVFALLREARALLLGSLAGFDPRPWAGRLRAVETRMPDAVNVLVRPDGYVAWAGTGDGLTEALTNWCGGPKAA